MKYEEGPRTPLELAERIRRRLPELFEQCGLSSRDLSGWSTRNGEFLPVENTPEDSFEADICFYEALLRGWLRDAAFLVSRYWNVGYNVGNLLSPLLLAWDVRLREMIEDLHSGDDS